MVILQRLASGSRHLPLLILLATGAPVYSAVKAVNCLDQLAENEAKRRPSFAKAAIVIGISNPTLAEGPRPVKSAKAEAEALIELFQGRAEYANQVYTLLDEQANTKAVELCLDGVAKNSRQGSKVFVFISARGYYVDGMPDGFILTDNSALDKIPSASVMAGGNGVSISALKRKVRVIAPEGNRYLFLDLFRAPAEFEDPKNGPDKKNWPANKINGQIRDSEFYRGAETKTIILASSGIYRSLPFHFARSLAEALRTEGIGFDALFNAVKEKVLQKSGNQQTPVRGPELTAPEMKKNDCLQCMSAVPGPLLASAAPMASFAEQDIPDWPEGALTRRIEAARAEEAGQEIFVRYGEGNHFPGDPLAQCENPDPVFLKVKLCAEQFEGAARKFSEAAGKYVIGELGDAEGDRQAVASLEERARFSRAQALLLGKQFKKAEEELASGGVPFAFAESHNLLGISYLEQGEYERAEAEFRAATEKARYWGYPRHNLALALVEHGSYGEAERVYREAIATTPVGEMFHAKLNSCFAKRRVLVGARPYLYYNLGVLLQRLNRLGEARTQFCLAEASFRLSLDILKAQGAVLPPTRAIAAQTNPVDGTKSAEDFEVELATKRAIAALRNLGDVKNSQGVLLQMRGKRKQAAVQFKEALDANPGLLAAKYNWAQLREKKEPAEAKKLYGEILADAACHKEPKDKQEMSCGAARKAKAKL